MRVDYTTLGPEPPDNSKTGRAGQAAGNTASTTSTTTSNSTSSGASASASGDQTSFSFDQTRVRSLATQALAQPEIREAKVQSLQQAIGNGEYSVPPSQIADALVSELGAQG